MSFLNDYNVIVPAGGELPFPVFGSMFAIKEASAKFDFIFDDGRKNFGEGGYTIYNGNDPFRKITFFNRSATLPLTVYFLSGDSGGRKGVEYEYLRQRDTKARLYDTILGAGQSLSVPGVALGTAAYSDYGIVAGARRAQIVITNSVASGTANSDLTLINTAGLVIGTTIIPGEKFTLPTSTDFKLYNANAGGISLSLIELFYD